MHHFSRFDLLSDPLMVLFVGDRVEEQQKLQQRCFTELQSFSKLLAMWAGLKYGTYYLWYYLWYCL
jgi:hypothetical protein